MNIVEFNEHKHYEIMKQVWAKYDWQPCPLIALPNVGFVAETKDGVFIAYLGLYLVPGKIGFIDWALSDTSHGIICGKALCKLIDKLIFKAKEFSCCFIYSVTKTEAWKKILVNRGILVAEKGVDTFIMSLNNEDTSFISD